jgi:tRNA(adenine34) deaminase
MHRAVKLAAKAKAAGEVPVGALVVSQDGTEIIAEAFNQRESFPCATQHAEIAAIQAACKSLGSWRLNGCTLVVTLEPCLMCAGAIMQGRIDTVIFGAYNPKNGAFGSLFSLHEDERLNHTVSIEGGIEEDLCRDQLNTFFAERRQSKPKARSADIAE